MFIELLLWWYGRGWLDAANSASNWVTSVERAFSAGVLLRTLFSPWKQIVTLPSKSFDAKFHGAIDNLVSRSIGFVARFFTLIAALVCILLSAGAGLLMVIAWPLIPLAIPYLIYRGVVG